MNENMIYVGFGRVDITPKKPMPLAGYGNPKTRISRVIRDNLFVSCYALKDEKGETALLLNYDACVCDPGVSRCLREEINEKYGIKKENIHLAATHSHSTPDMRVTDVPFIDEYEETVKKSAVLAAEEALNDLAPSKILVGEARPENLNFVRHYKAASPDMEEFYFGDNYNDKKYSELGSDGLEKYATHATKADNRVHIIKFVRENAKDLLLINWRAHATLTGGIAKYDISSDFPGETRKLVEQKTDCFFTYFQGASGNINSKTRIVHERITKDCTAFSNLLSDSIVNALDSLTPINIKPIKSTFEALSLNTNHTQDHLVDKAKEVWDYFVKSGSRPKANALGREYGFNSIYHAAAVRRKAGEPETINVTVSALSLGDLAIIFAPNELFDTTAMNIENKSDYKKMLTFGYCDSSMGYVPTKEAYEYGCYEADNSSYAPGSAEKYEDAFIKMLSSIK